MSAAGRAPSAGLAAAVAALLALLGPGATSHPPPRAAADERLAQSGHAPNQPTVPNQPPAHGTAPRPHGEGVASACGGAVRCRCGDTVTTSYALTEDLGPCPGHGLLIRSKVTLDCGGFKITGTVQGEEERFGIFLNGKAGAEVRGATVKSCRVSGFLRGIRLRAATDSVISGNTASGNGDTRAHVGYGIDISGASSNNLIENNQVHDNADEGIHIGTGSHRNRLVGNVVRDNYRENLYLLSVEGGVFVGNTLGSGGVNSLYLKDSRFNRFEGNTFVGKTARVIGDSHDNQFVGNTFSGAGVHFVNFKGQPPRHPVNNRVSGGAISEAADCVRFTSSTGNVVADVALSGCETAVRSDAPAGPSDNTVVGSVPGKVRLDEGSTLNLGQMVTVSVRDAAGAPVAGARVEARDTAGHAVFSASTDDSGATARQVAITAVRTAAATTPRGPLALTVTKPGYAPATQTLPLPGPGEVTISLDKQ